MAQIRRIRMEDVVDYFDELEDPRSTINLKHPLVCVVVIAMMGVLAGANGPTAIARWAKLKEEFLRLARPEIGDHLDSGVANRKLARRLFLAGATGLGHRYRRRRQ